MMMKLYTILSSLDRYMIHSMIVLNYILHCLCGYATNSAKRESYLYPIYIIADRTFFLGRELNSLLAENTPTFLHILEGLLFHLSPSTTPTISHLPYLAFHLTTNFPRLERYLKRYGPPTVVSKQYSHCSTMISIGKSTIV